MTSADDLRGEQPPLRGVKADPDAGAVKRLEQAFNQALEARRFEDAAELLSEMDTLPELRGDTGRAWLDLQRARLDFHQDRLPPVRTTCEHLLAQFASRSSHTREEEELLGEIWALQGAWARRVGQMDLAIASYENSRSRYASIALAQEVATIDRRLGLVYRLTGEWKPSIDHYEACLHVLEPEGEPGELATVLNDLGNVYRLSGNLDRALELCRRSLQIRETLNNPQALGLSSNTLGMIYRELGLLDRAKEFQQKAIHFFLETRDRLGQARGHNNLGYIYYREGDLAQALKELDASLDLLEHLPDRGGSFRANTLDKLGRVRRDQGQYDQALELFKQDLEIAVAYQDYYQQAEARYELCVLYRLVGDWDRLLAESLQTRQIAEKYDYFYFAARTWEIQGDIMLDRKIYLEAFADYRNALDEMLKYTAKRYEELALRLADHFHTIPDSQAQGEVLKAMSAWARESRVEERENRSGSAIHVVSLLSQFRSKDDKVKDA